MKEMKEEQLVSGGRESANRFYSRARREFVYKRTPEAELSLVVD